MFFSPNFKTVHVHIDRAEQMAVNHRWRHLFGWSVQLTVDNETSKYWSALIYRSRKISSPTVRQCTFYNGIWQERRRLWLGDNPVDVPRQRALGGHRRPFTWFGGVCKRNSDQPLLSKLASAGGWWKLTDRHCLDCPLRAWRASKINP